MTDAKRCTRCGSENPGVLLKANPKTCTVKDHTAFHDPPEASEPPTIAERFGPDFGAIDTRRIEGEKWVRLSDANEMVRLVIRNTAEVIRKGATAFPDAFMPKTVSQIEADAKREQMDADCDLLSEMASKERQRESQALRAAAAAIRAAWVKEHDTY